MSALFFLSFVFSHAQQPEPLFIGQPAPEILTLDHLERRVSLSDMLRDGPVVVHFFLGPWSRTCRTYLSQLQDSVFMLRQHGASVIAIGPFGKRLLARMAHRTEATFPLVFDEHHRIMERYRVKRTTTASERFRLWWRGARFNKQTGNPEGVLPVTATYLIARDGSIYASHFSQDSEQRLAVRELLMIVSEMEGR